MKYSVLISVILLGFPLHLMGQDQYVVSTVNLKVKQNRPTANIPEILLLAYSRGDIKAYYPRNPELSVSYVQFLLHFGMTEKAAQVIRSEAPEWFCQKEKEVKVAGNVIDCMKHKMEVIEKRFKNHITYQMEQKIEYVKLIYSSECTTDGLEKEGPLFKLSDINRLTKSEYKIINPNNPAVSYYVADFLKLRLFAAD